MTTAGINSDIKLHRNSLLKHLVFVLLFVLLSGNSCEAPNQAQLGSSPAITSKIITGKIAIKGNEPRTWVCLTTASGVEYRLKGELTDKIRSEHQQETITIKGTPLDNPETQTLPIGFEVLDIQIPSPR